MRISFILFIFDCYFLSFLGFFLLESGNGNAIMIFKNALYFYFFLGNFIVSYSPSFLFCSCRSQPDFDELRLGSVRGECLVFILD